VVSKVPGLQSRVEKTTSGGCPALLVWMGMGGVMRTLLAIFTCHRYEYTIADYKDWFTRPVVDRVQGIRDSWLKNITIDYKFFYGFSQSRKPYADEIFLPCPDDYHHSYEKIRGVIKYALDHNYDYLIKIDDDCYVYWDRLAGNLPTGDYVGSGRGFAVKDNFSTFRSDFAPGFTYSLSRKAMGILLASPAGPAWAEDRWVGETLRKRGIPLTIEERFHLVKPTRNNQYISDEELKKPNDWLTFHSASPDQMRRLYKHTHGLITR
jgi:hypothetical protein